MGDLWDNPLTDRSMMASFGTMSSSSNNNDNNDNNSAQSAPPNSDELVRNFRRDANLAESDDSSLWGERAPEGEGMIPAEIYRDHTPEKRKIYRMTTYYGEDEEEADRQKRARFPAKVGLDSSSCSSLSMQPNSSRRRGVEEDHQTRKCRHTANTSPLGPRTGITRRNFIATRNDSPIELSSDVVTARPISSPRRSPSALSSRASSSRWSFRRSSSRSRSPRVPPRDGSPCRQRTSISSESALTTRERSPRLASTSSLRPPPRSRSRSTSSMWTWLRQSSRSRSPHRASPIPPHRRGRANVSSSSSPPPPPSSSSRASSTSSLPLSTTAEKSPSITPQPTTRSPRSLSTATARSVSPKTARDSVYEVTEKLLEIQTTLSRVTGGGVRGFNVLDAVQRVSRLTTTLKRLVRELNGDLKGKRAAKTRDEIEDDVEKYMGRATKHLASLVALL